MDEILTLPNVCIYLVVMNLIGFLSMLIDKKKAEKGSWRTPEKTLLTIGLLGGSIGSIIGMYVFHHKTKKLRFSVGLPVILILQIVTVCYLKYLGWI